MAELTQLTPRQEQFAQAYLATGIGAEAYRQAYPRSRNWKPDAVHVEASKMRADPRVALRIEELSDEARRRNAITVDSLTADFRDAIELAKKCGNPSAYVSALNGLMKLHGLGLEKRQVSTTKANDALQEMSLEELEDHIAKLNAEIAEEKKKIAEDQRRREEFWGRQA